MNEYACWFCGETIERADTGAVMIGVENLWRWSDGARRKNDPWQGIYAHSACAKDRMAGESMALDPTVFGEDD